MKFSLLYKNESPYLVKSKLEMEPYLIYNTGEYNIVNLWSQFVKSVLFSMWMCLHEFYGYLDCTVVVEIKLQ